MSNEEAAREQPITATMIIKWSTILFAGAGALISLVWFAASIKGDIIKLQQEDISIRREYDLRTVTQDREIASLKVRASDGEKSMGEMARKLDVAVTLLERIDKKMGTP